jgi:hypothetical protein
MRCSRLFACAHRLQYPASLYIVLTLIVLPTVLIAGNRHWLLALVASGLVWLSAQAFADFLSPLTHSWYLNPFAWQFLFTIGLIVGIKWDSRQPALSLVARHRWVVAAAWVVVVAGVVHRLLYSRSGLDIAWLQLDPETVLRMKENLSFVRITHFLSVALLVAIYFRQDSPILKWSISAPVIKTGAQSLELFSLSCVLGTLVDIVALTLSPSFVDRVLIDGAAFLLLALVAITLAYRRTMVGGVAALR